MTGFLGGIYGEEIKNLLNLEKIDHHFIKIKNNTRMNITISNSDHLQTRFNFKGPHISLSERLNLINFLEQISAKDMVIMGGSFNSSITITFINHLIFSFKKKNIICWVDFPGEVLHEIIKAKPNFIKPNLKEFKQLSKTPITTIEEALPYIRKLLKKVPLICISSIEGGALLASHDEIWFGKIPKVKIRSSVGAGDSMVGAMAALIAKNKNTGLELLLRMGLAAACATLTEKGLILGSKKQIKKIYSKIILNRLY